jgi:hypothetical protein
MASNRSTGITDSMLAKINRYRELWHQLNPGVDSEPVNENVPARGTPEYAEWKAAQKNIFDALRDELDDLLVTTPMDGAIELLRLCMVAELEGDQSRAVNEIIEAYLQSH